MPIKEVETPYPRIDSDPHFSRVVSYFRPADYAVWAGTAACFPRCSLLLGCMADPTRVALRTPMRLGGQLACCSNSMTARFWGWSENEREFKRDLAELSQRAQEGKPSWVQQAAAANSTFSQLKFNFVNHNVHGSDPAKYGVQKETSESS
ncbi:hypothetical protein FA13DRAFT_1727059 [Coprinellus micaceus]|uniref:NADH-ubiquinone oxidoreductase 21kDa subunit N-terminal domain-containing protein n=1 Tax=Coprinellus micaceus TaxID=71717 RepID=A0A4Y7TS26_COPMI|nr:hypothetical protein FA13DRAFT_1727059 [Coprinellus micaceus]